MTSEILLDTSTLSEVIKGRDPAVSRRAQAYLAVHLRFTFSILTRYEIRRGLEARGAARQIVLFDQQCGGSRVLPLTDEIVVIASQIYGELWRTGQLISDADILIAATARHHGLDLVSKNRRHFERIPGLAVTSWRQA